MKKEVFLAILAGTSIGLIFAFGIWKVTKTVEKKQIIQIIKQTPKPNNKNTSITLNNVNNFEVFTKTPTSISGVAYPNSYIVASTEEKDFLAKTDDEGNFTLEIDLVSGLSKVEIANFFEGKELTKIELPLIYSTEVSKVIEENEEITAYVGTVTDINSQTLQIKSASGDIVQVNLEDQATYINTIKDSEIKASDIAIGDFILALGVINSKDSIGNSKVLRAKRIIVTEDTKENNSTYIYGKISEIGKNSITIVNDENEEDTVTMPKKWVGPDLKDLEENMEVILAGTVSDKTYTLRTLYAPVE